MLRLFATAVIALVFGLGGGYAGAHYAKQEIIAAQKERFDAQEVMLTEVARRTMALINGLTSLAVDSEIVAADIMDLRNRVDRIEVVRTRGR
jgi:hypothetical protein